MVECFVHIEEVAGSNPALPIFRFMTEKKQIEKATAEKFIEAYNTNFNTSFVVKEQSENPDIICEDQRGAS